MPPQVLLARVRKESSEFRAASRVALRLLKAVPKRTVGACWLIPMVYSVQHESNAIRRTLRPVAMCSNLQMALEQLLTKHLGPPPEAHDEEG